MCSVQLQTLADKTQLELSSFKWSSRFFEEYSVFSFWLFSFSSEQFVQPLFLSWLQSSSDHLFAKLIGRNWPFLPNFIANKIKTLKTWAFLIAVILFY